MFRGHYLLSTQEAPSIPANFEQSTFENWNLYAEKDLEVFSLSQNKSSLLILGIFFDPIRPDLGPGEIAAEILGACQNVEELFRRVQDLSGRFTLFVITPEFQVCIGDASNLKEIIYGKFGKVSFITSSLKFGLNSFEESLQISDEKKIIVEDPVFAEKESMWYGARTVDDRCHKVMTNHYLDLKTWGVSRKPLFKRTFKDENEIMEFVSSILKNTFKILTQKFKVLLPVTGGWDSRILLAASKAYQDKISYYVFQSSDKVTSDIWIPQKLSESLGFEFRVLRTYPLKKELKDIMNREYLYPRFLKKTEQIQYHYDHHYGKGIININGNGSEVFRYAYGYSTGNVSFDMLMVHCKYWYRFPFFVKELKNWYKESKGYAKNHGFYLLDLYYWEHRVGNWVSNWQTEQSMGIEEITPFNNVSLITAMLQVAPARRRGFKYTFIRDMIEKMWPETLQQPFNPGTPFHKRILNKHGRINYFVKKLRQLMDIQDRKVVKS